MNKSRTKTGAEEAKGNEANQEGNKILAPIVTRAGGSEDPGATDNDGVPKEIPPCPRTTKSQTTAQPLTKGEVRGLRS